MWCALALCSAASAGSSNASGDARVWKSAAFFGTRNVHPCWREWNNGQPCQESRRRSGAKRFRTVRSSVPGAQSFFGFARSQYHFGQWTGGGFAFFSAALLRVGTAATAFVDDDAVDCRLGLATFQSNWLNQGSFSAFSDGVSETALARRRIFSRASAEYTPEAMSMANALSIAVRWPFLRAGSPWVARRTERTFFPPGTSD